MPVRLLDPAKGSAPARSSGQSFHRRYCNIGDPRDLQILALVADGFIGLANRSVYDCSAFGTVFVHSAGEAGLAVDRRVGPMIDMLAARACHIIAVGVD